MSVARTSSRPIATTVQRLPHMRTPWMTAVQRTNQHDGATDAGPDPGLSRHDLDMPWRDVTRGGLTRAGVRGRGCGGSCLEPALEWRAIRQQIGRQRMPEPERHAGGTQVRAVVMLDGFDEQMALVEIHQAAAHGHRRRDADRLGDRLRAELCADGRPSLEQTVIVGAEPIQLTLQAVGQAHPENGIDLIDRRRELPAVLSPVQSADPHEAVHGHDGEERVAATGIEQRRPEHLRDMRSEPALEAVDQLVLIKRPEPNQRSRSARLKIPAEALQVKDTRLALRRGVGRDDADPAGDLCPCGEPQALDRRGIGPLEIFEDQ